MDILSSVVGRMIVACVVTVAATYPGFNPYHHPYQHSYQHHHPSQFSGFYHHPTRWPYAPQPQPEPTTTTTPRPQLRLYDNHPPPQEHLVPNFRTFPSSFGGQRSVLGAIDELSKRQELLYRLVACALLEKKEREDPVCERLKQDAENVFAVSHVIERGPSSSFGSHLTNLGSSLYSGLVGFVSGNKTTSGPNVAGSDVVPTLAEYPEIEIIDLDAKKEIPEKRRAT